MGIITALYLDELPLIISFLLYHTVPYPARPHTHFAELSPRTEQREERALAEPAVAAEWHSVPPSL